MSTIGRHFSHTSNYGSFYGEFSFGSIAFKFLPTYPHPGFTLFEGTVGISSPTTRKIGLSSLMSSHGFVPKILILSLLCSFWQLYTKYPPQDDFYVALPKVWSIFLGGASTSICHFFHLSVRLSVRSSVAHQSQVSGTVHHLIIIFGTHIV